MTSDMALAEINPEALGAPRGYSNGLLAPVGSRLLFIAGQTAGAEDGVEPSRDFAQQFEIALMRTIAVVREAGGAPGHIGRMVVYVTSIDAYRENRARLRPIWQRHMGTHYPAMALIEVRGLVDRGCQVELEAIAALPPSAIVAPMDRNGPIGERVL